MSEWKLYSHDLWGNRKEGYEINDYYPQGEIRLSTDPSTDEVIKVLKKDGYIKPRIHKKSIEVEHHEDDIYVTDLRTGRPEYTIRRTRVRESR